MKERKIIMSLVLTVSTLLVLSGYIAGKLYIGSDSYKEKQNKEIYNALYRDRYGIK